MMIIKHIVCVFLLFVYLIDGQVINIDGSKLERIFDGIGGLSGGGATSRFLPNYESPYIDEILDYLFLPNFGASLHILKVEIGGDAQSTEGTEASHMHTADDLNYERGYEWWLMQEAKKRNPDIKLYGLTWGVPGWIGGGNTTNYYTQENILYHINWLKGAKGVYGFDVDYIGVWNERMWNDDWIISFRSALDQAGFDKVQIVAPDRDWGIANDILANPQLMESVAVVGAHYPGTVSTDEAVKTGKPLWASEDYSSFADSVGGGCWARILNQNYVNGYMTATISWNLIAAYYNNVPWAGCGLMIANNPWSGHYDVMSPIWVTAHTTQFTAPGWIYLAHGNGTGHLPNGGSYVTLVPPNNSGDFSMIIETFTRDHSVCVRPYLNNYTVTPQTVTFQLAGGLKNGPLYVWYTHLTINGENILFEQQKTIQATNGQFTLDLDLDSVVTVSTLTGQQKGQHPDPPASTRFPTSYSDDFNSYNLYSEAKYFDDQTGSWEIQKGFDGSLVMRQMVLEKTIYWCDESEQPVSVIGPFSSASMDVEVRVYMEDTNGTAALGIKVQGGGCGNMYGEGFFLRIDNDGNWNITGQGSAVLKSGKATINSKDWTILALSSSPSQVCGFINGVATGCVDATVYPDGFAAIGSSWTHVQFDNFKLNASYLECASGSNIISAYCESGNDNQLWTFNDDSTIRSQANPNSCISASSLDPNTKNRTVVVTDCNPSDPLQIFTYDGFSIKNPSINNGCLRLMNYNQNDCAPIEVQNCEFGDYSQNWWYNSETQQIIVAANMMCITMGTAA